MNKKEFINNILKIHSVAVSTKYIKPKHCLKCGACIILNI